MIRSFKIIDGLPFVQLKIWKEQQNITLKHVLVDTGSASTIFKLERVEEIGIVAESQDHLGTITGVGGKEFIFLKTIEKIEIDRLEIHNVQVDIGTMDYGFDIDGILGMDLMTKIKSIIDLNELKMISMLHQ